MKKLIVNKVGLGILVIVLVGLIGYSYYYLLPFGPRLNNPDYDEEISIIIEFEDKNDFSLFVQLFTYKEKFPKLMKTLSDSMMMKIL